MLSVLRTKRVVTQACVLVSTLQGEEARAVPGGPESPVLGSGRASRKSGGRKRACAKKVKQTEICFLFYGTNFHFFHVLPNRACENVHVLNPLRVIRDATTSYHRLLCVSVEHLHCARARYSMVSKKLSSGVPTNERVCSGNVATERKLFLFFFYFFLLLFVLRLRRAV